MERMFESAEDFKGRGLEKWQVSSVISFDSMFENTLSLTACTKRIIYDSWVPQNAMFGEAYPDWKDLECDIELCTDTHGAARDSFGDGCEFYYKHPSYCGLDDDNDFTATQMCCVCGGGELSNTSDVTTTALETTESTNSSFFTETQNIVYVTAGVAFLILLAIVLLLCRLYRKSKSGSTKVLMFGDHMDEYQQTNSIYVTNTTTSRCNIVVVEMQKTTKVPPPSYAPGDGPVVPMGFAFHEKSYNEDDLTSV